MELIPLEQTDASEMPQYNVQDARETAARLGIPEANIFWDRDDLLLLDLDWPVIQAAEPKLSEAKLIFDSTSLPTEQLKTISKSGNHHLYIRLSRNLPFTTRVGLQAALGSDKAREMLLMKAYLEGKKAENVLFETDKEAERVRAWLGEDPVPF